MIKLKNVSKEYIVNDNPYIAVDNVSLTIDKAEYVAIMGRSGAGKSTLLHILGCLDNCTSGEYCFNGRDISKISPKAAAKIRNEEIGFVLQDFSLINHQTALYNVMSPMFFNKTPFKEMKPRAMNVLEQMGIADQAHKKIINMSGGQKQRVAIARAIVTNPSLILADEPTGSLDTSTEQEIMDIFDSLNNQGKTIIIVTHDNSVASHCNRIITMSDGKIS